MPPKWSLLLRSFSLLLTVVCDTMHFGKEAPFQRNILSLSLASNPEGEVAGSSKMLVPICWTAHHSSQDNNLRSHHCEYFKLFPLIFPHLYSLSKIKYGSRIWRFNTANTVMPDPLWESRRAKQHCVTSYGKNKVEVCSILRCYAALMFWDNLSVHFQGSRSQKSLALKTKCQTEDEIR